MSKSQIEQPSRRKKGGDRRTWFWSHMFDTDLRFLHWSRKCRTNGDRCTVRRVFGYWSLWWWLQANALRTDICQIGGGKLNESCRRLDYTAGTCCFWKILWTSLLR